MVVDDWVDHGMRHGEPVEREEDMLNIVHCHDFRIVIGVDEIGVIGKPANTEYQNQNNEHSDDLEKRNEKKIIFRL